MKPSRTVIAAVFAAAMISHPATGGILETGAPSYLPIARPVCATAAEIDVRLTTYGLVAEPRLGMSRPGREAEAVSFSQRWHAAEYTALVKGNRDLACIVAVAKD